MKILRFAGRLFHYTLRAYEWASGRRHYPWTSSPPHKLFAKVAQRAYGWPGAHYRAVYAVAGGVLKYRERLYADRINFDARVGASVNAATLRNAALWQKAILDLPPLAPKFHANIRVLDDKATQLDRLMSVLLMSENLRSVNVFFDDEAVRAGRICTLTVTEEKCGSQNTAFDLDSEQIINEDAFESAAWSVIFSNKTGFDRSVNNYLKIAHPGAFVVALGLPENVEGFSDDWLAAWQEAVQSFRLDGEEVTFVVLNGIGPDVVLPHRRSAPPSLAFARKAGLSLAESICLAQKADAFIGQMDVFGLAARAARRPGIYLSGNAAEIYDGQRGVVEVMNLDPALACDRLRQMLGQLRGRLLAANGTDQSHKELATRLARQPRAQDELGRKYTLLVPTYNRPETLGRLLGYLQRQNAQFPILILDSSSAEVQEVNRGVIDRLRLNIRHVPFAETTEPYAKMRNGLQLVESYYCSICADDDLLIPTAAQRCVEALEHDGNAAVAHGYYFNFNDSAAFNLSYVVYRGGSIDCNEPLARLKKLFDGYEAVTYGVVRAAAAQRAFRDVDTVETVLGKELLTAALSVIGGKVLRLPEFYYGRSTAESFSYTGWHPHQILAEAPLRLFSQYPIFRKCLLEALSETAPGRAEGGTEKIIDLVLLRYLQPFLRHDVLDLIIDMTMRGQDSMVITKRIWDVFVRSTRDRHPVEPLLDQRGRYSPNRVGAGGPRDYESESRTWDAKRRRYVVFYEFLFPDMHPPALVNKEKMVSLLNTLNAY